MKRLIYRTLYLVQVRKKCHKKKDSLHKWDNDWFVSKFGVVMGCYLHEDSAIRRTKVYGKDYETKIKKVRLK